MQTIDEVKLNQQELTVIKTETQTKLINRTIITNDSNIKETSTCFTQLELDTEQIETRYVYSQYLLIKQAQIQSRCENNCDCQKIHQHVKIQSTLNRDDKSAN